MCVCVVYVYVCVCARARVCARVCVCVCVCARVIGLNERFGINEYPSFYLFSAKWEVLTKFQYTGVEGFTKKITKWADGMTASWARLFTKSKLVNITDFDTQVGQLPAAI